MDQIKKEPQKVFEKYKDTLTLKNKIHRMLWNIVYVLLFRPFALPYFKHWRNFLLRCWGAQIGEGSVVHASAEIWAPWNLVIGCRTCIGPHVIIYNPGRIILGNKVVISQYSYLCTASHHYEYKDNKLFWKEIIIDDYAWIAAKAFVAPGVHIGTYAVVGATASVYKEVEPWTVVGGNPAKFIKKRIIKD